MWYYLKENKPIGPLDVELARSLVKSGQILSSCLVWREGMSGWEFASATELRDFFSNENYFSGDSISEKKSQSDNYYLSINQRVSGPFSINVIIEKLISGEITSDSLCWTESMKTWSSVSEVFKNPKMIFGEFISNEKFSKNNSPYGNIPFYRRNWFFLLCIFVCQPLSVIVALSGDVYYIKDGKLCKHSTIVKTASVLLGIVIAMKIIINL